MPKQPTRTSKPAGAAPVRPGLALRRARMAAGLSQGALAARARVTVTAVQHWENGRRRPNPASRKRLARALGVPEAELVGGGEIP